jgi:DNA processing protein
MAPAPAPAYVHPVTSAVDDAQDAAGPVGPEAVAACALSAVPGLGPGSLARLAVAFGSLEAALAAGARGILALHASLDPPLDARAVRYLSRARDLTSAGLQILRAARAAGARVVLCGHPAYPGLLRGIERPPSLLYVRGPLDPAAARVAVVGSRDADEEGLRLAREIAEDLARAGVQVVSGGARGVDAAAHEGALWGQGTTAAVLGCGIDVAYPPAHGPLFERLAHGGGAVVSEFPPGAPGSRMNFPRRNRTISGLSSAVVVVRASLTSGALITAREALRHGRLLFAVPGPAGEPLCAGPNRLLAGGAARPATSAADVLRALGWQPPQGRSNRPEGSWHRTTPGPGYSGPQGLGDPGARLLGLLEGRRPLHLDELAKRAGMGAQDALRTLQDLELRGLCFQRPGKYYLRWRA